MNPDTPNFSRPRKTSGRRRAHNHNYRGSWIYMISINCEPQTPPLSKIIGDLYSHDNPPNVLLSDLGKIVNDEISNIKPFFPNTVIINRKIMPEHIHFIIYVNRDANLNTSYHLGEIIQSFKSKCNQRFRALYPTFSALFEEGYHDRILLKKNQLERMKRYLINNPRRRLERTINRHYHQRTHIITHNGTKLEAYGNIRLLEEPQIEAVRLSQRFTSEETLRRKRLWKYTIENSGVLISPFISENERKVMDWAIEQEGRLIVIINQAMGERYHPGGRLHELVSAGLCLILAPADPEQQYAHLNREACLRMNDLAEEIAQYGITFTKK